MDCSLTREEVAPLRDALRLRDVPAGEVGRADVHDLALLHQDLHRLPDLLPGRAPVDVVHLVQVEVVGLQPRQRRLARPPDVQRGQLARVRPLGHVAVQLGGQHGLLPPAAALGEPLADDRLGAPAVLAPAVHVGGVEEVDPDVQRPVHDLVRRGLFGHRTEVHRAEAEPADPQASPPEVCVIHVTDASTVAAAMLCRWGTDSTRTPRSHRWAAGGTGRGWPVTGRSATRCTAGTCWRWPARRRSPTTRTPTCWRSRPTTCAARSRVRPRRWWSAPGPAGGSASPGC